MTEPEIVYYVGRSGTQYQMNLYNPALTTFFEVPGIYLLCRRAVIGGEFRYEALYAGEAQSLKDRLNTQGSGHDGYKRAVAQGMDRIAAMVVTGGLAERLRIETDLRHGLNPVCNAQSVPTPTLADLFYPKG